MSASSDEITRITAAIAKNVGIRWCSTCQMDRAADGFKRINGRWICADCQARRKKGVLPHQIYRRGA